MKFYNYLLFRLYKAISKNDSYSPFILNYLTTIVSSLYIFLTTYTIWCAVDFYLLPNFNNEKFGENFVILYIAFISFINYYFFVKKKKFLELGYKEDSLGGYLIIIYIIVVFACFILIANKNREKITIENERMKMENYGSRTR